MKVIDDPDDDPGADVDTVTIIVEAFRAKFGDDAIRAATLRRDLASADSREKWDAIVDRLRAGQMP